MQAAGHWQSAPCAQLVSSASPATEQPLSGIPVVPPLEVPVLEVPELEPPVLLVAVDEPPVELEVEPLLELDVAVVAAVVEPDPLVPPLVVKGALPGLHAEAMKMVHPAKNEHRSVSMGFSSGAAKARECSQAGQLVNPVYALKMTPRQSGVSIPRIGALHARIREVSPGADR
jgi:hypothetical protein